MRTSSWRELGRPEASLVGAQFAVYHAGARLLPYVVRRTPAWLFRGTGLRGGSSFGHFGIEVDAKAPSSPRQTIVLARIPARGAEMTYYETARGAKVFAFGAFTLAGVATQPPMKQLLDNLWARLEQP